MCRVPHPSMHLTWRLAGSCAHRPIVVSGGSFLGATPHRSSESSMSALAECGLRLSQARHARAAALGYDSDLRAASWLWTTRTSVARSCRAAFEFAKGLPFQVQCPLLRAADLEF